MDRGFHPRAKRICSTRWTTSASVRRSVSTPVAAAAADDDDGAADDDDGAADDDDASGGASGCR